ncbi:IclR family transcriptional regulator [Tropicimonas sp. IMCC6043]|uniref:IclR family transcriptional regulator n=1 Tax=Tropicimonas sp. IMCC6043 TaxID=2510645 RepID=UPI00101C7061|nr:IclR family transcriptional regulator [Tropicimonas sp. IMCC6043]RYH11679.1 IclR family transcriptional regulator [Tropicimonas sp. IMCC6043]
MASAGDGTVGKALDVLDLVSSQDRPVRFAELQRMSALPKATLYRLVQTLVNQGMLVQNPEAGTYSLGVRLVRLAHAAWRQASLAPIARPHLDALSLDTGLTVHLAQMDYGHVLYVDRRNALESAAMFTDAGKVGPAYCTGVGKAMLAYLDADELEQVLRMQSFHRFTPTTLASEAVLRQSLERTRARGYAIDREEHMAGVICVAMPILSDSGRVIGAASLSGSTPRTDIRTLETHVPRLRKAVEAIAEEAAQWAFPVEGRESEGRPG